MRVRLLPLLLVLALGAAQAQVLTGTRWESLSPPQREALAPLASQWAQLDPASQDTWAALARRYPSLSSAEQQRLRERMQHWAQLSPAEREQARRGHAQAQHLAPEDRAAKWERFQSLPPERKQALLERASARRESASAPASAPAKAPARPLLDTRRQLDERTLLPRRAASAP